MAVHIKGASEHNLRHIDVELGDGLTAVTGVSGSGKSSLAFDTLYHESRRRFQDLFALGSPGRRLAPARVDAIASLGPAVAVGQNLLNRNPASTVATASGLHPFLRLFYAHFGERACPRCGAAVSVHTEEEIAAQVSRLSGEGRCTVAAVLLHHVRGSHATLLSLLQGQEHQAMVDGSLWDGGPLDGSKPHTICLAIDRLERRIPKAAALRLVREAFELGVDAVSVAVGGREHLFSRSPVCVRCGAWLEPLEPPLFHTPCPSCGGRGCGECRESGLHPRAAAVRWEGRNLTELLRLSAAEFHALFSGASLPSSARRLRREISRRSAALCEVGLGYVGLDRPSPSLSRGESQRMRLAVILTSRLEDMLHVLDEPTIGQHPEDVVRLLPAFRRLKGPVVFVEHDRTAAAAADRVLDLGPGAGTEGGRLLFQGPFPDLLEQDSPTGRFFSLRSTVAAPGRREAPDALIRVRGASLYNLKIPDCPIPLHRLTVVTGVSGSGKSTLICGVLAESLARGNPVGCAGVEAPKLRAVTVDQKPIGKNPRSNPATYTKLADAIRDLFAEATGLSASHFSFNRPEGACPTCRGLGALEVPMRYLPPVWIPCADCEGRRYTDRVLQAVVRLDGRELSIADFYDLSIRECRDLLARAEGSSVRSRRNDRILAALMDVGLGYLSLGQPSPTLSGGEAQRVKLARYLGRSSLSRQLLILDEPTTGLHPHDISALLLILDRLVQAGATAVVIEHNTDVIRAADWIVDLGPGAGPAGGELLYAGPVEGLTSVKESVTGRALEREEIELRRARRTRRGSVGRPADSRPAPSRPRGADHARSRPELPESRPAAEDAIRIKGARAHNLKSVDVSFPKGKLSVVAGVSGSGKSSLVSDVLQAEARRRHLESLSLYERQGVREGPEAEAEEVTGLGVAVALDAGRRRFERRATVGSATEISHYLAVLFARLGERPCPDCGAPLQRDRSAARWLCRGCGFREPLPAPRHFLPTNYAAACTSCHGVGSRQVPQPDKLIRRPDLPLCGGAMHSPGFFPKGYLCKPFNGGYYLVQALAQRYAFDPAETPWDEMSREAQQAFLFGDPEPLDVLYESRSGRVQRRRQQFPGFYGWIRDWDVGGTYTDTRPCPDCGGSRLKPPYAAVTLRGKDGPGRSPQDRRAQTHAQTPKDAQSFSLHALSEMDLGRLSGFLSGIGAPAAEERMAGAALQKARRRLEFLVRVGLGYLHLDRPVGTLSAGEAQRIRLAGLLGSELTSLTVLLDEPTRGLHPSEVQGLLQCLRELEAEGNTVIVVEHDPLIIRGADHVVDLGPGAGAAGGRVVAQGSPEEILHAPTVTGSWLRGERVPALPAGGRRSPSAWMHVTGARENNLAVEDAAFPLGAVSGVCGVSGSGKSTLVIDTLGRALAPIKQTTSVAYEPIAPGAHDAIRGAPSRCVVVDQSKAGLHSPAAYLGVGRVLREIYAASDTARSRELAPKTVAPACGVCRGRGALRLDMGFLPSVEAPCEACGGSGFSTEAWMVKLHDRSLPELWSTTMEEVYELWRGEPRLEAPLRAARDVGLGYLLLGQPGYALSGGEAQRLKIAGELCGGRSTETLYILDEPTVGQHLEDVSRLIGVLHRLADQGHTVIVVEHHPMVLAACDWIVELGPGGGSAGGRIVAAGTPEHIAHSASTASAPYLKEQLQAMRSAASSPP